jgi:hypothetical protein
MPIQKKLLENKIKELEKVIDFRDNDEEWLNKEDDLDKGGSNKYFWFHAGIQDEYKGKLKAIKELLGELK